VAAGDVLVEVDGRPVPASIGVGEFKALLGSFGRPCTLTFNICADENDVALFKAAAKAEASAIGAQRSVVAGSDEARCKLLPAVVVTRLLRKYRDLEEGGQEQPQDDEGRGEQERKQAVQDVLLSQTVPAETFSNEDMASAASTALARFAAMDVAGESGRALEGVGVDEEDGNSQDMVSEWEGGNEEQDDGKDGKESGSTRSGICVENLKKRGVLGRGFFGTVYLVEQEMNDAGQAARPLALKRMFKQAVVQHKQEAHVLAEKDILDRVPPSLFLLNLVGSFQDKDCLYLLTNFVQGGELLSILPEEGLEPEYALFYFANVFLALSHLHKVILVVLILYSYCTRTVLILYSYCTHTLYSYCTRTVLIHCTHTLYSYTVLTIHFLALSDSTVSFTGISNPRTA
jgi:hypothetical protein